MSLPSVAGKSRFSTRHEFDDWQREAVGEIAGTGDAPGEPANIAPKRERGLWPAVLDFAISALIVVGAVTGTTILIGAVVMIVRSIFGG